jgi:hypothetical protein
MSDELISGSSDGDPTKSRCGRSAPRRLVLAVLALALGAAAWLRIPVAGDALLFGDELHSLHRMTGDYGDLISSYSPTGSGMALPLLQRLLVDLFGASHWTLRAPALLAGLALVGSLYPLGRGLVGRSAALVATLLAASSSFLIYYSHFARAYALMAWLSLLLVCCLQGMLDESGFSKRRLLAATALVALLPFVHLTAIGFVLPVFVATWIPLFAGGRRRQAWQLAGALTAGLVLASLLHLPAARGLLAFVSAKTDLVYFGSFGPWDVAALLAGGRLVAIPAAGLLALALVRMGTRQGLRALPLMTACVCPIIALAVAQPFGDAYAYARYAINIVPFACLAVGWLVVDVVRGLRGPRAAGSPDSYAIAAGVVMACAWLVAGPYGPGRTDDGPFSNTYISLFPLPAFDRAWDGASLFYRDLADDDERVRIVEVPALHNRTRHLYRNHYLQHGMEVWLGFLPEELETAPDGPYVEMDVDSAWSAIPADYLVVHHRIRDEVRDYWRFVYETPGHRATEGVTAAYMARHSRYGPPRTASLHALRSRLESDLGQPVYQDHYIEVWALPERRDSTSSTDRLRPRARSR